MLDFREVGSLFNVSFPRQLLINFPHKNTGTYGHGGWIFAYLFNWEGFHEIFYQQNKSFLVLMYQWKGVMNFFNHFLAEFQKKNFLCAVIFWSNYLGPVQKYWDVRCMGVGPNFWPKLQFKFFSTFNFCTQTYWLGPGVPKSQNFEKRAYVPYICPHICTMAPRFL